ncbi:MAG: hypothetical protein ACRCZI_14445 [Cetobacterium sp.]
MLITEYRTTTELVKKIKIELTLLRKAITDYEKLESTWSDEQKLFLKRSEFIPEINELFLNFLSENMRCLKKEIYLEEEINFVKDKLDELSEKLDRKYVITIADRIKELLDRSELSTLRIEKKKSKDKEVLITEIDGTEVDRIFLNKEIYKKLELNKIFNEGESLVYIRPNLYIYQNKTILDFKNEKKIDVDIIEEYLDNNILILQAGKKKKLYLIDKKKERKGSCEIYHDKVIVLNEKEYFLLHENQYYKMNFLKKNKGYCEYQILESKKKIEEEEFIHNKVDLFINKKENRKLEKKVVLTEDYKVVYIGAYDKMSIKRIESKIDILRFVGNNQKLTEKNIEDFLEVDLAREKNEKYIFIKEGVIIYKLAFPEYIFKEKIALTLEKVELDIQHPIVYLKAKYKKNKTKEEINLRLFPYHDYMKKKYSDPSKYKIFEIK